MKKKIFSNWVLKLFSVVIAFVLWLVVVQIEDPPENKSFNNIPVKLINTEILSEDNKVYEILDGTDTTRVTVRAPRSVIDELEAGDIVAEADVSKLSSIDTIAINFYTSQYEVESIKGSPDTVVMNIENKKSKWVPLKYNIAGEVEEGYMVGNVTLDQNSIQIEGPESAVSAVAAAYVNVNVSGLSSNLSANMEIELYDKEDKLVETKSISKRVDSAHIQVEVLATKTVPVELNVTGEPAEGYMQTGIEESIPADIKIAGSSSLVNNVSKIAIPEGDLDITGAESSFSTVIDIRKYLPSGIRLADSSYDGKVSVTIYIEPTQKKKFDIPVERISVANVPEGWTAQLPEEERYELQVEGLGTQIAQIQGDGLTGIIDVAAWMEEKDINTVSKGVYEIPVTFALPEDVEITSEVTVKVTFAPATDI